MQVETLKHAAAGGDGNAGFELAQWHARRGEMPEAMRWLEAAAGAGHAEANHELGMLAAAGDAGRARDAAVARRHFRVAAAAGHGEAAYRLAVLDLGEESMDVDAVGAALERAAHAGWAPAQRALGMAWAAAGDVAAARACLASALARGDVLSAFLLARLTDDIDAACGLDALAARSGIRRAQAYATGGVAATGLPAVPPWPGVPPASAWAVPHGAPVIHHDTPPVATVDDVFSALECEYVIALAASHVQPSRVVDPATGRPMAHPIRTSSSIAFPGEDDDAWLRILQRRLADLAQLALLRAEPLAVLRYEPGEEYRPHRDYLRDPAELAPQAPGQRVRTAFAYLTDVEAGGETDFPLLGVRIVPARGRVVLFDNVDASGRVDPSTLHAGLPVLEGCKWLATLWFRERACRAW